jgi:hypothetical protein
MSNKQFRIFVRWAHIIEAAIIGTYLYSPWSANPVFSAITLYVVFPLMALSGVLMWQQPRVMKLLKRGERRSAG